MVSAVPAGEVMARDEVLGMTSPAAATMATTSGVVRFPGSPPTQCLSTTRSRPQSSVSPVATISRVRAITSPSSRPRAAHAVRKADRCTRE